MATKSPLTVFAPAESPEEEARLEEIRSAREALRKSLDARQAPMFDPVLLAMAQGFLTPTKSGSFGEALGNVAALVGPAQAAEEKRAQEVAMMKAELAQQELAQMQATRGYQDFQRMMGGRPGAQAAPSATPAATPGATPAAAPGAPTPGAPAAPDLTGARPVSARDVAMMKANPNPQIARYGDILEDMIKSDRDRYVISQNGIVFDRDTQKYLDIKIPGQTASKFPTPYGSFDMTPYQYSEFETAQREGKGREWLERFTGRKLPETPPGMRTPTEAKQAEIEAEQRAKSRGEQSAAVRTAGRAALGLIPVYDRMESLLKTPGIDQVMGVLERGDTISALGSLVEEAIRVGNFSVGIPQIRKIVAQTGAPQEVIDRAAELGQLLAITQFEQRKGLGSGTSVSNFEQQMVNAMGPNMTDTLRSFGQKLSFMREKARFEHQLAQALRQSKMEYEDFEDTPEFAKMFGDYQRRVTNIVYPGRRQFQVQR